MIIESLILEEIVNFEDAEEAKVNMLTVETIISSESANHIKVCDLFLETVTPVYGGMVV